VKARSIIQKIRLSIFISRNVIIDVDVGSDDAWACLMLLKFEKKYNIKVQAITCVHGNTTVTNVAKNLIRVLRTIDRLDVPIYLGAEQKLIPPSLPPCEQWHGCNGFCDHQFDDDIELKGVVRKEHAVNAMRQILMDHKNVSLICIGPLTNLALLLKMYPEITSRICKTYIMGGNRNGVGNITRTAEFNFYGDPESAFIAFDSLKSDIVLLPWESCLTKNLEVFSMVS
jgi:inosine-uridine nucleoside N-ribohydrolase